MRIFGFPAFLYFTLERMKKLGHAPLRLSPESLVFLRRRLERARRIRRSGPTALYAHSSPRCWVYPGSTGFATGSARWSIAFSTSGASAIISTCRCGRACSSAMWRNVENRWASGKRASCASSRPYMTSVPAHSVMMGDLASPLYPASDLRGCGITTPFLRRARGVAGTSKNKSCAVAAAELLKAVDHERASSLERRVDRRSGAGGPDRRARRVADPRFSARRCEAGQALLGACERLGGARLRAGRRGCDALRGFLLARCLRESGRFDEQEARAPRLRRARRRSLEAGEPSRENSPASWPRAGSRGADPFKRLERIDFERDVFRERGAPIGFLVHIAPTNAINVPFLSVVEGLLAGNVCFVKTGGSELIFPQLCLRALVDCDASGSLAAFIYAAQIPSRRQDLLKQLVAHADGVAVWGGEEAISGIRAIAPPPARVIRVGT